MYDWASSAFTTTVATVFLGPYLAALVDAAAKASVDGQARLLGLPIAADSFLPYCIAFSVAFQAGILPILGAIADYSHRRKAMLHAFAVLGALATLALFFVQGALWWLGGVLFIVANLAFGASTVLYNAYLPDIASEGRRELAIAVDVREPPRPIRRDVDTRIPDRDPAGERPPDRAVAKRQRQCVDRQEADQQGKPDQHGWPPNSTTVEINAR